MTARPCLVPGCPNHAARGPRCPRHQKQWDHDRNQRPERQAYRDPTYRAVPLTKCVDCGTTQDLTRDHIIELHQGGTNDPNNIEIRCRSCNVKKSNEHRRNSQQ